MRAPAFSLRHKLISFCAAALLACGLAPAMSFADESNAGDGTVAGPLATGSQDDFVAASFVLADSKGSGEAATPNPAVSSDSDGRAILASSLASSTTSIVSADVALDAAEPVVGSFTADGLTYAVGTDGLMLVAVAPDAVTDGAIAVPASVTYNGVAYPVTAVGPYAFYLSGATDVALPASITAVDDCAFRSSDVERIEVDPANPNLASFNGALYDAPLHRLLLIPEGRKGSVLLSCETEVMEASKFSHCSLVEAISVEEGGAAFSSWNDCLYSSDGMTLLRAPAGATDITIHDGCTTIAAGALEGCAKLERINAPASVTSISPDVFASIPTVALPAQTAMQDDSQDEPDDPNGVEGEAEVSPRRVVASSQGLEAPLALPDLGSTSASPSSEAEAQPSSQDEASSGVASSLLDQANASADFIPQLNAMVALSSADDGIPEVNPSSIEAMLPQRAPKGIWQSMGLNVVEAEELEGAAPVVDTLSQATTNAETLYTITVDPNGHTLEAVDYWSTGMSTSLMNAPWSRDYATGYHTGTGYFDVHYSGPGYVNFHSGTPGWHLDGFSRYPGGPRITMSNDYWGYESLTAYARWIPNVYTIRLDAQGGSVSPSSIAATYDQDATLPAPAERQGYKFLGWNTAADGSGAPYQPGTVRNLTTVDGATVTLYAQWSYSLGFDTSSEPGDEGYPGDAIDDKPIASDDGQVEIEDPKRPGYVFEGWVIPTEDGTEAIDQDLVYQGDDGKWYVDASKLPDYADSDGKVELTARWTSIISVDVPSSVTFYADLVTQGQESREGAASSAFGQSKVENQSEIDLRVVGLESSAVKTTDSTLGADSILKKASTATPSTSTQKLLSLYPSTKAWTADDLKDPDAVGGTKAAMAVDFDLDDILLEKSFAADDFTIAAGSTLNMGYRLNLSETGQQLDYDKLSTLVEGQSASIANVSYTFAGDAPLGPTPSGDETDSLYVTVDEAFITANGLSGKAQPGTYGLADIKAAAEDIASKVTVEPPAVGATADQVAAYWDTVQQQASQSDYYALYKTLLDKQVMDNGTPIDSSAPYFQLKVDGATTSNGHLPLQLIGIAQDTKSDDTGKAGLTFQMRDIYAYNNTRSTAAGGDAFNTYMNLADTDSNGWGRPTDLRSTLRSTFWGYLPTEVQSAIVGVNKYQQLYGGTTDAYLQKTTGETVWLPSTYEVFGTTFERHNESEALTSVSGYVPFQYMAYQGNAGSITNTRAMKTYNNSENYWWLRSAYRSTTNYFSRVHLGASCGGLPETVPAGAAPCFCL